MLSFLTLGEEILFDLQALLQFNFQFLGICKSFVLLHDKQESVIYNYKQFLLSNLVNNQLANQYYSNLTGCGLYNFCQYQALSQKYCMINGSSLGFFVICCHPLEIWSFGLKRNHFFIEVVKNVFLSFIVCLGGRKFIVV